MVTRLGYNPLQCATEQLVACLIYRMRIQETSIRWLVAGPGYINHTTGNQVISYGTHELQRWNTGNHSRVWLFNVSFKKGVKMITDDLICSQEWFCSVSPGNIMISNLVHSGCFCALGILWIVCLWIVLNANYVYILPY